MTNPDALGSEGSQPWKYYNLSDVKAVQGGYNWPNRLLRPMAGKPRLGNFWENICEKLLGKYLAN